MGKRVIGVMGSYRKGGTIDQAVTAVLDAARARGAETVKIDLLDQHIEFCKNCRTCCQAPGAERGQCVLEDDMDQILRALEAADGLVLGAPVNFGDVNALTRRFLERMVGLGYWPWRKMSPKLRGRSGGKRAVLVTASAAPGWMTRFLQRPLKSLRQIAALLGARVTGTVVVGLASQQQPSLGAGAQRAAERMGARLAG